MLHGKPPSRLEEIGDAPVPLDCGTGKPFEYRLLGDRATLMPRSSGGLDAPQYRINYELIFSR